MTWETKPMTDNAEGRTPVIGEVLPFGAEELLRRTDAGGRIAHAEWLLGHELEARSPDEIERRFDAEQRA